MDRSVKNDGDMMLELRETALDTALQQLRLLHALSQRAPAGGGPGCDLPTTFPGGPSSTSTSSSDFLFDLARVSLGNYEAWLRLSANHFDFLVDALRKLTGASPPAPSRPALELRATGKIGGSARVNFVLENPDDAKAEVAFMPPALHTAEGTTLACEVRFVRVAADGTPLPGAIVLFPRECARLQVAVDVKGPAPGMYRGESIVVVGGRIAGRLCLTIDVVA